MCSKTGLDAAIGAMAAIDVPAQPLHALMQLVESAAEGRRRLHGIESRALGEIAVRGNGRVPGPAVAGGVCPTPAWLRSVAKATGQAAGRQVRTSVALRELPAVADAIVDGQITHEHGHVLTRLVGRVDPAVLLESQPALIEVACRTDPDQLAQYVRHLLATWCEPDAEAEEAAAEDRRFLQLRNTHRGSWRGTFELPDAAMEAALTVLETLARRDGNDERTAGQRRADALADAFELAARHADLPEAGGSRPLVTYVVPAWWSSAVASAMRSLRSDPLTVRDPAGVADPHRLGAAPPLVDLDRHPGEDCATAAWTGPATRSRIEALLCEARVQRVLLDDSGQVVSLASATDAITAGQRRAVAARDRCCTAKGCSKPPAFCDVHHLWARADGGPATVDNLVLLCRRHHVMWHRRQLALSDLRVPWKRLPQPRAPDLA